MHLLFPPTLGCEVLDSAHFDADASFHPIAAVPCNPSLIRTHQSPLFGLGNSLLYSDVRIPNPPQFPNCSGDHMIRYES
jgi:hypothetical protein